MADLECVPSRSQIVSMKLHSVLKLPPISNSASNLQRSISCPSTSSPVNHHHHPPFHKFILSGGPGFSLALLDSLAGSVDRLPVPLPVKFGPGTDVAAMTNAEIVCVALVGETQVWAGTESGGLHVYELSSELRLTNALYSSVESPVLCICGHPSRPTSTDVVIGTFNGNILVFSGPSDERGGLKDPFKNPRIVVQLGSGDSEAEAVSGVNSIVPVHCSDKDTFWCACGGNIVVVAQSNWRELRRLDCRPNNESCPPIAEVVQLLSTDSGVWSCLSKCSVISLWNTKTFAPHFHFACE